MTQTASVASRLAALYGQQFGGKHSGRYRLPRKLLADMMGRRRLYEEDIGTITRALLEEGYILIDMESFFVVMSAKSFVNFRRLAKEATG